MSEYVVELLYSVLAIFRTALFVVYRNHALQISHTVSPSEVASEVTTRLA